MKNNKTPEPEAYTLGSIPFVHTEIYLDSRPLIPRTETEYWVMQATEEIKTSGVEKPKILDLCAGSGCIGVTVLKEILEAQVDFAELDESHHQTIRKNIRENGLDHTRTRIFGGDLFENISDKYNFILSNPPYINPELKNRIQESVLEHEPAEALFGGRDGLEIIDKILDKAQDYLKPNAILYIEHEPEQVEHLSKHRAYLDSNPDQFDLIRFSRFSIWVVKWKLFLTFILLLTTRFALQR